MKMPGGLYIKKFLFITMIGLPAISLVLLLPYQSAAAEAYPWSDAVCVATGKVSGKCLNYEWSYNGQVKNSATGNYYFRNCTDYAAWRMIQSGVSVNDVAGLGNAKNWDNNASKKGFLVDSQPSVSAVGVDERNYGHVAIIEQVDGNQLTISEFNWSTPGGYGQRHGTAKQLGFSEFIHFLPTDASSPAASPSTPVSYGVGQAMFMGSNQLIANQLLRPGQYIESSNTRYVLIMQGDGNLVEYGNGFQPLWSTHTSGNPGAYAVFQGDGNLVIYSSTGRPLWWSGVRPAASRLLLQDDGNLVNYDAAWRPLWASGIVINDSSIYIGQDNLAVNQALYAQQYLKSADGRYSLIMQSDGNLVVYAPGYHAIWHSHTSGNSGAYLVSQGDGNLVIYSQDNRPLWWSGVRSQPKSLVVQADGNLVQYSTSGYPLWYSGTQGRL